MIETTYFLSNHIFPLLSDMPMYPPSGDHRQLEIMKHWPPLWKSTIAQEKNPEKRKNLIKSYSQQVSTSF